VLDAAPTAEPLFLAETGKRPIVASAPMRARSCVASWSENVAPGGSFVASGSMTCGTASQIRWLKAGSDIYALSRHLGHTSVRTTEIYLGYLTEEERTGVAQTGSQNAA